MRAQQSSSITHRRLMFPEAGGSGLSLGVIIAIAASVGAVALAVIGCGVGCVLRRQKQRRRERESQTPATRKGLTPTEARPFFEDKGKVSL